MADTRVTIRDVAESAGVSISTVSRVLSSSGYPVSATVAAEVKAAAKKLGYHPNQAARSLRTSDSSLVAVITDAEYSPHASRVIEGVRDALRERGLYSVVINAYWDPSDEKGAIRELLSHSVAGVVFVETWLGDANEVLELSNTPFVHAHRLFDRPTGLSVVTDDNAGGRMAAEHLLSLGHRVIAHIEGPKRYYASSVRRKGFLEALVSAGNPVDGGLIAAGDWSVASGSKAASELLDREPGITALFAANDRMALGAVYAAQQRGLRVPEDLSVIGYDDEELASLVRPALTTVRLPLREIGEQSVHLLFDRLSAANGVKTELQVSGELIERDSTSAARMSAEGATG